MKWKGKGLDTIGELMRNGMEQCDTPEEAAEFMKQYRAESKFADQNVGYLTGYYGPDKMRRMQELFCVEHPVFGKGAPTMLGAFTAGVQAGKERLKEEDKHVVR